MAEEAARVRLVLLDLPDRLDQQVQQELPDLLGLQELQERPDHQPQVLLQNFLAMVATET